MFTPRPRVTRLVIFFAVAAVIVPVFFLGEGSLRADAFNYMVIGRNMAESLRYSYPPEHYLFPTFLIRPPMQSLFIAVAFGLGGATVRTALFVSQLMTALSLIGVYFLTSSLYGRRTGLVALGVAGASAYLVGIAAHIEIDPAVTAIILLGSAVTIRFLDRSSIALAVMAGITMAVALLIKEVAVMMVPLPVYLFLAISYWRKKGNFWPLVAYVAGFTIPVAAYVFYYYVLTGRLFLVGRAFEALNWRMLFVLGLLVTTLLILISAFSITRHGKRTLRTIQTHVGILGLLGAMVLWIAVTAVLVIAFAQNTAWVRSPAELVPRIVGFQRWLDKQAVPLYWPFALFIPAGTIVASYTVYKRHRGDIVLLWLFLCAAPLVLTLSPDPATIRVARYGFPIFWLIVILLARATMIVADLAMLLTARVWPYMVPNARLVVPAALWTIGFINMLLLPSSYDYDSSPLQPLVFNSEAVRSASRWIEQNVASNAVIGSTSRYLPALEFYTGRSGQFRRIYSWDGDLADVQWPQTTTTELSAVDGQLQLRDIVRKEVVIDDPIYLQFSLRPTFAQRESDAIPDLYYLTYSQNALLDYIQQNEIDYLVLSAGNTEQNMLSTLPSFFRDHPAFQIAFQYSWPDEQEQRVFTIYILSVDRTKLARAAYPVEISTVRNAWDALKARLEEVLPADSSAICTFVRSTGSEPIYFTPSGVQSFQPYVDVAESCAQAQDTDLAAYHYFLALRNAPSRATTLAAISQRLVAEDPDSSAAWLLKGNIDMVTGSIQAAERSIANGLTIETANSHVRAALLQTAGTLALLHGDPDEAATMYATAAEIDVFDTVHNAGLEEMAHAAKLWITGNNADSVARLRRQIVDDPLSSIQLYSEVIADPTLEHVAHWGLEQAMVAEVGSLDFQYQNELTSLLLQRGSPAAAQQVVQALVESYIAEPTHGTKTMYSYLRLVQLVATMGSIDHEEALYSTIIARWPDNYLGYYYRGSLLYTRLQDIEGAHRDLERAVELAPHEEAIYVLLAEMYSSTQQDMQLKKLFDFATQHNADVAWPYKLAAQTYLREWARVPAH